MLPPTLLVLVGLLFTTAVAVCGGFVVGGAQEAVSVFWGCVIFTLPTMYFTLYAFRFDAGLYPAAAARAFYWGQASKFGLMTMGFGLVFKFTQSDIPAVFVGFCLMIPAHIVIAMFVSKRLH